MANSGTSDSNGKNSLTVAEAGRRGGLKGGAARAKSMSGGERRKSARKAAGARWHGDPTVKQPEPDQAGATAVISRRRRQLALFDGAPGNDGEPVVRVYTEAMLAEALIEARGVVTQAAEIIGGSPTTIHKRLKTNSRLREVRRIGREILKDSCETLISDAIEAPCVHCGKPLLTAADKVEECLERPHPGNVQNVSRCHESFASIDMVERLRLATWFLKTAGKDRGFTEREADAFEIPEELISRLPVAHLADLKRRVLLRQDVQEILLLAKAS